MKRVLSVALLVTALAACATDEGSKTRGVIESMTTSVGGKELPTPSPQFEPQGVLPYPSQAVYKAVVTTLDDSRISIVSENKEDGRISTDYVAGPSFATAFGLLGVNSTRYKYLILVEPSGASNSTLRVTAFLESSGGSAAQSWRDVSADNQKVVANIQNALVENIEKHLKQ